MTTRNSPIPPCCRSPGLFGEIKAYRAENMIISREPLVCRWLIGIDNNQIWSQPVQRHIGYAVCACFYSRQFRIWNWCNSVTVVNLNACDRFALIRDLDGQHITLVQSERIFQCGNLE